MSIAARRSHPLLPAVYHYECVFVLMSPKGRMVLSSSPLVKRSTLKRDGFHLPVFLLPGKRMATGFYRTFNPILNVFRKIGKLDGGFTAVSEIPNCDDFIILVTHDLYYTLSWAQTVL